ncbi:MAG: peptide deformylase [Planctomycetota bacterium]|jgi:peptide deformylase
MPVYNVLLLGNPELRKKSDPIENFNGTETLQLLEDMKSALTDLQARYNSGLALAAPLIGIHKRVIYFRGDPEPFFIINPEISGRSPEEEEDWETCFAFQMAFAVKIRRPKAIALKYRNEKGEEQIISCEGKMARIALHGIDHLDGILALDHIGKPPLIMRAELTRQKLSSNSRWKKPK